MSRNFVAASSQSLTLAFAVASIPFSIWLRFRTNSLTTSQVLFSVTNGTGVGDAYYLEFAGNVAGDPLRAIQFDADGSSGVASSGATGISTGTWYGVGVTWEANNSRSVWFNGSRTTNTDTIGALVSLNRTAIGAYKASIFHDGQIAEVGVWDAFGVNPSLTNADFAALNAGASPKMIRPTYLRQYWPLGGMDPENSIKEFGSLTNNNASTRNVEHPRVYR